MKTKVVFNGCFGGYSLSPLAQQMILDRKGIEYIKEVSDSFMGDHISFMKKEIVESNEYQLLKDAEWDSLSLEGRTLLNSAHLSMGSLPRHDADLVAVVEELGDTANGSFAKLNIAEIEGNQYFIDEYDGSETVETPETQQWVTVDADS